MVQVGVDACARVVDRDAVAQVGGLVEERAAHGLVSAAGGIPGLPDGDRVLGDGDGVAEFLLVSRGRGFVGYFLVRYGVEVRDIDGVGRAGMGVADGVLVRGADNDVVPGDRHGETEGVVARWHRFGEGREAGAGVGVEDGSVPAARWRKGRRPRHKNPKWRPNSRTPCPSPGWDQRGWRPASRLSSRKHAPCRPTCSSAPFRRASPRRRGPNRLPRHIRSGRWRCSWALR